MAQNVVPLRPNFPIFAFHPLADVLPLLEGSEYDDLVASIRVNGQRDPIVVADGMILDGRNRYRACRDCGKVPDIKDLREVAGENADPRQYVIDKNLLRRHLTESQRAGYMCRYATYHAGDAKSQRIEKTAQTHEVNAFATPDLTVDEAAALAQVSDRTIQCAKVIFTEGTEEEKKAVLDGTLKVKTGARQVRARRLSPPPQQSIPKSEIEANPKKPSVGARLVVPTTERASEWCRRGMVLEDSGKSAESAAKEIGMPINSYRQVRDIVLLASHPDLQAKDQKIGQDALCLLDETRQLARAYEMVRPIADRVWGHKGQRNGGEKRRLEQFEESISLVVSALTKSSNIEVPYLTQQYAKNVLDRLRAGRKELAVLIDKIEESIK